MAEKGRRKNNGNGVFYWILDTFYIIYFCLIYIFINMCYFYN